MHFKGSARRDIAVLGGRLGGVTFRIPDASVLLTVEVFFLQFVFFTCGGGTVGNKNTNPISGWGENHKQKRPNPFSTVSTKDQTEFQPKKKPRQFTVSNKEPTSKNPYCKPKRPTQTETTTANTKNVVLYPKELLPSA